MFSRWFTVTTTTSPRFASRDPCRRGALAVPYENAPPWNQTITGFFVALLRLGDQTFRVRQSSVSGEVSGAPEKSAKSGRLGGRKPCCGAWPV